MDGAAALGVEAEVASLRLAYREREPRAGRDRLGIAAAGARPAAGVAHSAAGDMTAIEQEGAPPPAPTAPDDLDDFNSVFTMIRYPLLFLELGAYLNECCDSCGRVLDVRSAVDVVRFSSELYVP